MRYEEIRSKAFTRVDVAALHAAAPADEAAPGPFVPTPAAPDVPAAAGKLIVGSYVALLASFALATVASAYSVFMVAIGALFLVAFFTVPWLFLKQEPGGDDRPSMPRFMLDGMDTLTGHSSGRDALIQMLIVPVSLTLGVLMIAVVTAITL